MLPVDIIDDTWRYVCDDEMEKKMKYLLRLIISKKMLLTEFYIRCKL